MPESVHVGFVDEVAMVQDFIRVVRFFPVNILSPWLSILAYHLEDEQQTRWLPQFRDIV
jgi:hypothetical protein